MSRLRHCALIVASVLALFELSMLPVTAKSSEPRYQYSTVRFPNRQDGFILATANSSEYLLSTTNDGRTWTRRLLAVDPEWFHFVNASDGWLVGSRPCHCLLPNTLYRTRDGGRSWHKLMTFRKSPPLVQFASSRRGWAQAGFNGKVFETNNGGSTWHRAHWPFRRQFTWTFRNARAGWASVFAPRRARHAACMPTQLYATDNGGHTWTKRPTTPGCYTLPSFSNAMDGWMLVDPAEFDVKTGSLFEGTSNCIHDVGCPSALLRTTDGGRTWTTEHPVTADERVPPFWPGGRAYGLAYPVFTDVTHGWMVVPNPNGGPTPPPGESGGITTTADGGLTWHFHHLGLSMLELAATSDQEAWVTAHNYDRLQQRSFVLHTTDDGHHWKVVHLRS